MPSPSLTVLMGERGEKSNLKLLFNILYQFNRFQGWKIVLCMISCKVWAIQFHPLIPAFCPTTGENTFRGKYFSLSFEITITNTTLYLLLALKLSSFVRCYPCDKVLVSHVAVHTCSRCTWPAKSPCLSRFQIFSVKLKWRGRCRAKFSEEGAKVWLQNPSSSKSNAELSRSLWREWRNLALPTCKLESAPHY